MSDAEHFNEVYENEPEKQEETKVVNKWALRDRLHSKVAWEAIVSLVMALLSAFGVWEKIGITEEWFQIVATALFGVFAAFGIFNDPTNHDGF